MNCIDAVEGTAKSTLESFLEFAEGRRLDASEYIQIVKNVIAGVIRFVENNPEVSDQPELIRGVLYDYAKKIWLANLEGPLQPESEPAADVDREYQAYCYDYVFDHGNYPR